MYVLGSLPRDWTVLYMNLQKDIGVHTMSALINRMLQYQKRCIVSSLGFRHAPHVIVQYCDDNKENLL
jgi:hypothetical protein